MFHFVVAQIVFYAETCVSVEGGRGPLLWDKNALQGTKAKTPK